MADIGTLTPEQMLQQQQILRQQKMAEMLMQKGMEQPQGQMISGHYVRPSIFQNLAGLANTYVGQRGIEKAEQAQLDMAKAIREGQSAAMADYYGDLKGRPAVEGGIYNPQGQITKQTTPDMYGADMTLNPQYKQVAPIAEKAPDPFKANLNASMNEKLPAFVRQHAMKELGKGPDWKEINQVNKQTGETEIWRYDANSPKPRDTLQFLGTSKAALTPHEVLTLNDSGVGTGRFGNPYGGTGGNVGGGTSAVPVSGGSVVNPAVSGGPSAKTPVSGKTDDLIKQFGYNPFEAPKPPPTLVGGPQIRKFYADQASPLPAESQKTVRGAINYQKAVEDLQTEFAGYSDLDLAKPNVRAKLQQKLTNAYLLGKEANTLGALTGPDMGLLEKLVTDPTAFSSLILDRKTINSLYDAQRKSAGDTIRESYRLDQKAVPEDLRSHIMVKPRELPMSQAEVRKAVTEKGIKYDPAYEYQINPDGTVDRRKKR